MTITRREMIRRGAITAAVAAVPAAANATALDPEALEVAKLFMRLDDPQRAAIHNVTRCCAGLDSDPALHERAARS